MPFIMVYAIGSTNYPKSYWRRATININDNSQTANFLFNGYASVEDFNAGNPLIDQRPFVVTNPNDFKSWMLPLTERVLSVTGTEALEAALLSLFDFFGSATQVSAVEPLRGEIGLNGSTRVTLFMLRGVALLSGDWHNGVTIKVDGVAATISASSQNPFETNELRFDLADPISPGSEVTLEYDMDAGRITDESGFMMTSFAPFGITNTVGEYLWFDDANNSIWLGIVG